jgi:hypothetical protein
VSVDAYDSIVTVRVHGEAVPATVWQPKQTNSSSLLRHCEPLVGHREASSLGVSTSSFARYSD